MASFKDPSERSDAKNNKSGTSSRSEQKFLIQMPCKYHKKGLCKLGKSCRFLHANQKAKKPSTVNLPTTAEKTVCVQISKFGRRPFLQLVVLYASDARVSKYAEDILEMLLVAGIDVVVQNSLQQAQAQPGVTAPPVQAATSSKVSKAKDIKAEHLAELICTSHADFLIVVGDKNMKNRSCQAKRKGKLLEMMVEDVISLIWKSWPQNPHKTLARIKSLTTEQTTSLLFQYCGPKHIGDRWEYLNTQNKEILSAYKIGSWCNSLEDKLSNLQKCAITLHKQLKKAMKVLSELNVQVDNPELSRGAVKTFEYKPSACRTPKSTIAYPLQIHLYCFIVDLMKDIEGIFDSIRFPTNLWNEYHLEHVEHWQVNYAELDRIREEMWKALEEHEKALLDEEEGKRADDSDDDEEEGMFSELKYEDLQGELFTQLEPGEKDSQKDGQEDDQEDGQNEGQHDPTQPTTSTKSDKNEESSTNSDTAATPMKFPFTFPMPKEPIFTHSSPPASGDEMDASPAPPAREAPKQQPQTQPQQQPQSPRDQKFRVSGGGTGRAQRPGNSEQVGGVVAGIGRGSSARMQRERDTGARRQSTGGLEMDIPGGEFGLGQKRDWGNSNSRGKVSASNRRASDFGVSGRPPVIPEDFFFDARGDESERQGRPMTTEERLIADQLDRQLERRRELERQLERECEVEKHLERQLEERKTKNLSHMAKQIQQKQLQDQHWSRDREHQSSQQQQRKSFYDNESSANSSGFRTPVSAVGSRRESAFSPPERRESFRRDSAFSNSERKDSAFSSSERREPTFSERRESATFSDRRESAGFLDRRESASFPERREYANLRESVGFPERRESTGFSDRRESAFSPSERRNSAFSPSERRESGFSERREYFAPSDRRDSSRRESTISSSGRESPLHLPLSPRNTPALDPSPLQSPRYKLPPSVYSHSSLGGNLQQQQQQQQQQPQPQRRASYVPPASNMSSSSSSSSGLMSAPPGLPSPPSIAASNMRYLSSSTSGDFQPPQRRESFTLVDDSFELPPPRAQNLNFGNQESLSPRGSFSQQTSIYNHFDAQEGTVEGRRLSSTIWGDIPPVRTPSRASMSSAGGKSEHRSEDNDPRDRRLRDASNDAKSFYYPVSTSISPGGSPEETSPIGSPKSTGNNTESTAMSSPSSPAGSLVRPSSPKTAQNLPLKLQHGFVVKHDPMAST